MLDAQFVDRNGGSLLQRIRRIAAANPTPEPPGSRLAGSVLSLALLTATMSIVATAPNVSGDEEVQPKSVQHQVGPDSPEPPTNTGTLRGRVIFNGTHPPRNKIAIDKDHVALEGKELFDESLIVDTGGGVANVFIWLQDANVPAPPVDKPPPPATLRIKNLRYDPHALAMTTSQKLLVVNDDPVATSPIFPTQTNPPTSIVTPRNSKHALQFHRAERLPIPVTASVHPWLKASLLVRDNPYFAITEEDGRFEIKNLPPGEWTFQFWHESAGYLKHKTGWPKGRLGVTINEGVSDIGKIDVTYEDFDLSRTAEPEP
ncbi:MAG TPA: hypothetical protein VMM76_28100 [Pirellulaceae bacterium]|nr:hypothetical protein [Pirellulaceae bacterium]